MSKSSPPTPKPTPDDARALISQRAQLQSWLDQLAEKASNAPAHVVERVRTDYQQRLDGVTDQLTGHLAGLQDSLTSLQTDLTEVESRSGKARDELEEARLRHMIGEIEDGDWAKREPDLARALSDAEEERQMIAEEVQRLSDLVREIEAPGSVPAVAASAVAAPPAAPIAVEPAPARNAKKSAKQEEPTPAAEPVTMAEAENADEADAAVDELFAAWATDENEAESDEALPWLAEPEAPSSAPAAAAAAPAGDETDLAFLEELDRVIGATTSTAEEGAGEPELAGALPPKEGVACKECGASNDARSWYCEICGMELT